MLSRTVASTPSTVTSSLFFPARIFSTASARFFSSRPSVPLTPRIASRNTLNNNNNNKQPLFSSQFTPRKYSTMAGPGSVITIESDADFKEKVLKSTGPAIVDCFAEWCGPCKAISPKVTEFSKTYTNATFFKIDIDRVPETAAELGIRAMPTFLLYKDGQRLEGKDVVGANPLALETAVKELIA